MKRLNPRLLIPIVLLSALIAGGWYVDTLRARQRSVLSGFFESQPTQVASRVGGRVARLLVNEGDAVKSGQPLIELENTPAEKDAAAKAATAEQARQQFREVVNGPRAEEIQKQAAVVAEMTANLTRLRNGPRPEEIAAARARVRRTAANEEKVRAGARPEEVAQARATERLAKARQAEVERGLTAEERAQVKARLDAAAAREALAVADAERMDNLYRQEAVTKQQWDRAQADRKQAEAQRRDAEESWRRAQEGATAEEREQARQAYRQAQAALNLVLAGARREDVQMAAAEAAEAQQNLQLLERGTRPEDIQAAEARLAQARAAFTQLKAGSRREQVAQAQAQAQAARAAARSVQISVTERTVRAPRDGVVERIPVAVGDLVSAGTAVARLANPGDLWMRVYIPEADLAKVHVGSEAALRVDGIAEPTTATVESIAAQGEFTPANLQTPDERGKQVFGVRLRLKRADPRIKEGMYATVTRLGDWEP